MEICGLKEERTKKREIKTLTATTLRNIMFLGQGAVRAVWILSAMKARGAAACCTASAFIPPLARSLWKVWPAGLEREVQWASSTLARKKNKGRFCF